MIVNHIAEGRFKMAFNYLNSMGKKAVALLNENKIKFTVKNMKVGREPGNSIQLNCNYGKWSTAPFAIFEDDFSDGKARLVLHDSGIPRFEDSNIEELRTLLAT